MGRLVSHDSAPTRWTDVTHPRGDYYMPELKRWVSSCYYSEGTGPASFPVRERSPVLRPFPAC